MRRKQKSLAIVLAVTSTWSAEKNLDGTILVCEELSSQYGLSIYNLYNTWIIGICLYRYMLIL